MGLRTYIFKRIIYSIILIYFVITVNFIIFTMMPGDPISVLAAKMGRREPEVIAKNIATFGLDQPLHVRYARYVISMFTFQFGSSYETSKPIIGQVGLRLQNTLLLIIPPEILATIIGLILGVIAVRKVGGLFDSGSVITSLIAYSLPVFWIATMLVLVFSVNLNWLPPRHSVPDYWRYMPPQTILEDWGTRLKFLILPWITLFLLSYGGHLLIARATMLECITEDYVLTARAKGLKERTVLFKHTLKNALLPIITSIA
jgi:peptide/nickel transport system permease protein